jgi:hypothetical protein
MNSNLSSWGIRGGGAATFARPLGLNITGFHFSKVLKMKQAPPQAQTLNGEANPLLASEHAKLPFPVIVLVLVLVLLTSPTKNIQNYYI